MQYFSIFKFCSKFFRKKSLLRLEDEGTFKMDNDCSLPMLRNITTLDDKDLMRQGTGTRLEGELERNDCAGMVPSISVNIRDRGRVKI